MKVKAVILFVIVFVFINLIQVQGQDKVQFKDLKLIAIEWIEKHQEEFSLEDIKINKNLILIDSAEVSSSPDFKNIAYQITATNYKKVKDNLSKLISLEFYYNKEGKLESVLMLKNGEVVVIE